MDALPTGKGRGLFAGCKSPSFLVPLRVSQVALRFVGREGGAAGTYDGLTVPHDGEVRYGVENQQ